MNIEKLIPFALAVVLAAASTGQLPKFIRAVQIAQFQLLKESQASKWPKALLLNEKSRRKH
ncbi:MAG: hypothetical protein HC902_07870 [Calothrix sp. SM1_5_4]|nr:hypothetical protein [Calothrix sp. SM1_5_4]